MSPNLTLITNKYANRCYKQFAYNKAHPQSLDIQLLDLCGDPIQYYCCARINVSRIWSNSIRLKVAIRFGGISKNYRFIIPASCLNLAQKDLFPEGLFQRSHRSREVLQVSMLSLRAKSSKRKCRAMTMCTRIFASPRVLTGLKSMWAAGESLYYCYKPRSSCCFSLGICNSSTPNRTSFASIAGSGQWHNTDQQKRCRWGLWRHRLELTARYHL